MAKLKLNKDTIQKASTIIQNGNYATTAQAFLRISQQTWYNWLNEGEAQSKLDEADRDPKKALYLEFFDAIKKAEATAEINAVKNIRTAGLNPNHWQANAWYLERKHPDRWGRTPAPPDGEDPLKQIAEAILNIPDEEGED